MNTAEKLVEEVRTLPEAQALEVLDFVAALKARRSGAAATATDTSVFERFGAVYEGGFNRDELYNHACLR
jgi:hypothetical protein